MLNPRERIELSVLRRNRETLLLVLAACAFLALVFAIAAAFCHCAFAVMGILANTTFSVGCAWRCVRIHRRCRALEKFL